MLVGRDRERAEVAVALGSARRGQASACVVVADAGVGKTALLDDAVASADGFAILRTAGHAAEADLPYAGLHQLAWPHAERLERNPRTHALAEALAMRHETSQARMSVAAGLLWFLADLATSDPVLVVIDDAQWLDRSSRQALIFAARRLDADRVAILVGARPDADPGLLDLGDRLDLPPLSEADSLLLLRRRHPELSIVVAERLAEAADGRPLALVELPRMLSEEQRRGWEPVDQWPMRITSADALYSDRIVALPARTRFALLLICLAESEAGVAEAALDLARLDTSELDPAVRDGLLAFDGQQWQPEHPAVRAAAIRATTELEHDRAHRVLAGATDDPVRRATHLEALGEIDEPTVVAALVAGAEAAGRRGGHAEAGRTWTAAARRCSDTEKAIELRTRAVDAYLRARAASPALAVLRDLANDASGDLDRARWTATLISTRMWSEDQPPGDPAAVAGLALSLLARGEHRVGLDLLRALLSACLTYGDFAQARRLVEQVRAVVPPSALPTELRLLGDVCDVMSGEPGAGRLLCSDWFGDIDIESSDTAIAVGLSAIALAHLDRLEHCEQATDLAFRLVSRRRGEPAARLATGTVRYVVQTHRGEWERAALELAAADRDATDHDFIGPLGHLISRHALLCATQGRREECLALLERMARVAPRPTLDQSLIDVVARGRLALATGDHTEAEKHLREAGHRERAMGLGFLPYTAHVIDLFEALWRLGRAQEMAAELADLERRAERDGPRASQAVTARCRALLAEPDQIDDAFGQVMALHEPGLHPFERARTELCWGIRLRRDKRRADARGHLHTALEVFERLRATAWAEQARTELAACGERRAMSDHARGPLATLTPREFQVASEVASGASNAETAQRLFISQRTVEYHLASVFRKLDLHERGSLARYFTT